MTDRRYHSWRFFLLSSVSWAADFTDGLVVAQSFSVVLVYTDVAPVDGS